MRPAFKFPRVRAAIDASHDAAQKERTTEGAAQLLLRRKALPARISPYQREDLAHGVRNMRQRLQQQRELWSKPKQTHRSEKPSRHSHAIGKASEELELPTGAIRDTLQKIRRQRERWSVSTPASSGASGKVQLSPPPLDLSLPRQGSQGAIVVDPRVSKPPVRPGNHIRTRIGIAALLVAIAIAVGVYESERLVSAVGKVHLFTSALLSRTGIYTTDSRRGADAASLRTAGQLATSNGRSVAAHPVPDSYGLFVLSDGQLKRLETMRMRVPDTRIALGGLVTKPSPVTLPGGKLSFMAYQRDLITNAPDNASVRVIAKVQRALKFSATGKPITTPVEDTWAIRSVSVDLTVAPVPESQEMILLRPADPELTLSPGRYMLVYKNQAYDFAVEGAITDTAQCLERTDSQDGAVYSECRDLP